MTPRIFISATSGDLACVRQVIKEALLTIDCLPVEQTNFEPDARTVSEMLRGRISGCHALIHIAGLRYGAEPDPSTLPPGEPRRSYTQMEYHIGRSLQHERGDEHFRVYTFICPENFPFDRTPVAESDGKRDLQLAHRALLLADPHLREKPADCAALERRILALNDEVLLLKREQQEVKTEVINTRRIGWKVAAFILLGLCGIGWGIFQLTRKTGELDAGQKDLTSRMEIDRLTDRAFAAYQERFRNLREQNRDLPNATIDNMIRAELPAILKTDAATVDTIIDQEAPKLAAALDTPISKKLSALFVMGRYETVISEGEKKIAEPAIASLQTMGDAARAIFEKTPDKKHLETAFRYYSGAAALMDKDEAPLPWAELQIWISRTLHDLGRYAEAEPIVRAAMTIRKRECGAKSPEYASAANNLGTMLDDLERYEEAEPLLREVVVASEAIYGKNHPSVAISLGNLAILLQNAKQPTESEEMLRRAIAIDEAYFGRNHEAVARDLNNLAQTLVSANRHADAEPLILRAIEITKGTFGTDHPAYATYISNLGTLLDHTGRTAEAEPQMRRALDIWGKSLGSDHINVAAACNNLGQLLENTGRIKEAEPLFRRAVEITEAAFGEKTQEPSKR